MTPISLEIHYYVRSLKEVILVTALL
nr:unnamed protein product [Callosobruchus analis]